MPLAAIETDLAILEQQAAEFLIPNLEARCQADYKTAVEAHNRWFEAERPRLEARQAELGRQLEELQAEGAEIDEQVQALEGAAIDARDHAAVAAHNVRVRAVNERIVQRRDQIEAFNADQTAFGEVVRAFNERVRQSGDGVQRARELAEDRLKMASRWFEQDGPEELWRGLRRLRALHAAEARAPGDQARLTALRERLERLRGHVERWFHARQASSPNGLVLSPAVLHSADGRSHSDCQMIVDTAASAVSLTREMVEVLGIGEFVGEEVELNLPNAIRIKAPSVLVPAIEVQGQRAEWVKGIVLDEALPGIAGSLGMSFLARFDYRIEGRALSLGRRAPAVAPCVHDVFLCHKSRDRATAHEVFDLLVQRGRKPFFSPVSVPEVGDADFQRVIDQAIEDATHMVLVCSSRAAIETPWVASEWRTFANILRSGQKRGNLVNLLCDGMSTSELPATLSRFHAVTRGAPGWQDELLRFLP